MVTENVGKESEDVESKVSSKDVGTGMFVICVVTTEMSPIC